MMQLILGYDDFLEQAASSIDISEGANLSAPVVEIDEKEDRPIVVFRPPQKKLRQQRRIRRLRKIRKRQQSKRIKLEKPSPLQPLQMKIQEPKPKKF